MPKGLLRSCGIVEGRFTIRKLDCWGMDLFQKLYRIYSQESRLVVILLSRSYLAKNWTRHELRAAQARALSERREYILPLLLDDCEPPDVFRQTDYLRLTDVSLANVAANISERWLQQMRNEGWITEDELVERVNRILWYRIPINVFMEQLLSSDEPELALQRALLALIYLIQEEVHEEVQAFIDFLLLSFPPITNCFNEKHQFVLVEPEGLVMRCRVEGGGLCLLMPEKYWKERYEEFVSDWPSSEEE